MNGLDGTPSERSPGHAKWVDLGDETAERQLLADPTDLNQWIRTDTTVGLEDYR